MCNDSVIRNHALLGRPTEGALIALAMKVKTQTRLKLFSLCNIDPVMHKPGFYIIINIINK